MSDAKHEQVKQEIRRVFPVVPTGQFDAQEACEKRIAYLKDFLRKTGRKGFVIGISGGVDSTTVGRLCQLACEQLRSEGYEAQFIAVRLPAGVQFDEQDAQDALSFINPDKALTINIGPAANELNDACLAAVGADGKTLTPSEADFHKGNIKARLRMTAQYHLAAAYGAVVIGSDHAGEALPAFYTRHGDQACDLIVLNMLNKRQVRKCAEYLGAPEHLWKKAPTADLEELNPGKIDDEGFGFPYEALDDFLEGKPVDAAIEEKIIATYERTRFKRDPIVEFPG